MALLKDTTISGSLRATDTIYTNKIQTSIIGAPTSSNGATFGVGTNGQVLKSNGTSVYWSSDFAGAKGDIIYWSATNTPAHLTNTSSTTKQFLSITSQVPAWSAVSKGDVGLGNVENTALSTWTGSNKITTVGTITSGTWQGTTVAVNHGGTGATSFTANSVIMSGSTTTAALTTRAITDNSSNADVTSSDTNLITGRTLYYQLAKKGYLTSHQTINQDSVTGAIINRYAICSTAASTAAKTASIKSGTFTLGVGATVRVTFTYSNTATNPTLNINSTGAKPIYKFGTTTPGTTPEDSWSAGEVVTLVFDGIGWQMSSNPIMGLTASQVAELFNLIG